MSLDLEVIEALIADGIYGDDRMSGKQRDAALRALAELLAEVADLEMMRSEHLIDNLHATEEGRETERAAIVAWLWGQSVLTHDYEGTGDLTSEVYVAMARAIEGGAHIREGA